jgi:hypothetical protein
MMKKCPLSKTPVAIVDLFSVLHGAVSLENASRFADSG